MSKITNFLNELFFAPNYRAALSARAEAAKKIQSAIAQSEIVERAAERNAREAKFLNDVLTSH